MNDTLTGLTAPAFIRGRLITEELVGFGGQGGTAMFRAPDPHRLLGALPLSDPGLLRDVQDMPFDEIVAYLAALGEALVLGRNHHLQEALELSAQFSDMTAPLVRSSFEQLPALFTPSVVRELADTTIGIPYLQGWVPRVMADGRTASIRAFGARTVHIIAGNSPLIAALSIIRNAVARSDAILKTPSNDPLTALAIARTMGELDPAHPITRHLSVAYWKGGDTAFEQRLLQPSGVEKIIAWGGLASVTHVLRYVQPGLELISLDPKRSATIIGPQAFSSDEAFAEVALRTATDIGALNQLGCVNARVVYVASGTDPDGLERANRLGEAIYAELQGLPQHLSTRAKWSDPELIADIDALRSSPEWYRVYGGRDGEGAVIVSQLDEPVEFSRRLSGRVANIVPIDDPADAIRGINAYTQTIGIYPETLKSYLREQLPLHGAQRLVSLGYAAHPNVALPQDGMEPMRRMVKWIVEERCEPDAVQPLWASASPDEEECGMTLIVDTTDQLTPQWFTQVLRGNGTLGAQETIVSVEATVIGTGQVGFVARAQLGYAQEGAGPATLVVKLPSADADSRRTGAAMGIYESEVRFYQEIAPRLGGAVPAMYWGDVEPDSGRFTLVLEDLQATSEVGDMVAGGTLDQAELAIGALATLQAPIWNDPDLVKLPWAGIERTEMLFGAVEPSIDAFVARFENRIDPAHLELAKRLAPSAAGSAQRLWSAPFVIAHGDYRLDNMMFGRRDGAPPITVIDWQGARLGPPLLDVAIYLGSCLSIDQRRSQEDRLLHFYHDRLRAAGVNDFSFTQCRHSYRVSSLYPFLLTIAMSMTLQQTERGDQMWAQMFTNSASIVADTGADALLD